MPNQVSVNIRAEQLLQPGTPLTVTAAEPMDGPAAQASIGIRGHRVRVELAGEGRTAVVVPLGDLPQGRHQLVVGEILDATSNRMGEPFEVPFIVAGTRARIPDHLKVEAFARIWLRRLETGRLPLSLRRRGRYIDVFKALDTTTDTPVELAFDRCGRKVRADRELAKVARRRARRYGKIHEALDRRMQEKGRIPVAFWTQVPAGLAEYVKPDGDDRTAADMSHLHERRLEDEVRRLTERLLRVVRRYDREATPDEHAPVVYAVLDPAAIRKLVRRDVVTAAYLYETKGVPDLDISMQLAGTDMAHTQLHRTGGGVRVAVWEAGPDEDKYLDIAGAYLHPPPDLTDHARLTHAIIKNTEPDRPHGHAPDCSLYSANDYSLSALCWAVRRKGCTVVNQSFHLPAATDHGQPGHEDLYKDYLALLGPYPTIVQAAGNYEESEAEADSIEDEYVNHKGYNGLTIGNHDDTAMAMAGNSVFSNPLSPHADRELPELSANGVGVTAAGLTFTGTSFAAPAAAGCAALLQDEDSVLRSWPEGCRAILLAGADRNPSGAAWQDDLAAHVDGSDGVGALNGYNSLEIARDRRSSGAGASARGWDVGTLRTQDFGANGMASLAYRVRVPAGLLAPRVRAALAWDGRPQVVAGRLTTHLAVDLDLLVFDQDGELVCASCSWDNSYELVEFLGTPGQVYDLRIRRFSGRAATWYGVAWTVKAVAIR
ncbi:Subtilase family protein [Nonomuraea solani]|uniref:Subtilase family protein n=1 Tax=Nonomuraea solani TaxID=1144553 RepID=A0A1H6F037_9ACTN|nr:S8 family serine peptidase [Nonomuraea solani]SEH03517.1 Subtilase family protein [Nonomuraea solani]